MMIETTIFLIVLICILVFLNNKYKKTNHYLNQFEDVRKFWKENNLQKDIQIVNLGSNHPKFGFDYFNINKKCANWAVGPQSLEYDFAILKEFYNHLAPNAVVIIPICLLNFFLDRHEKRNIHWKYYNVLTKKDIVGYSIIEKLSEVEIPILFHPQRIRYIRKDVAPINQDYRNNGHMESEQQLQKDAQMWIDIWSREFNIELPDPILSENNQKAIKKNISILKDMLEFCSKHGFKPIITLLPTSSSLNSRFTDDFIQKHIINYINEANTLGVPVLNYLEEEQFQNPELYFNSFFMNKKGRLTLTKQVMQDLNRVIYGENSSTQH